MHLRGRSILSRLYFHHEYSTFYASMNIFHQLKEFTVSRLYVAFFFLNYFITIFSVFTTSDVYYLPLAVFRLIDERFNQLDWTSKISVKKISALTSDLHSKRQKCPKINEKHVFIFFYYLSQLLNLEQIGNRQRFTKKITNRILQKKKTNEIFDVPYWWYSVNIAHKRSTDPL